MTRRNRGAAKARPRCRRVCARRRRSIAAARSDTLADAPESVVVCENSEWT